MTLPTMAWEFGPPEEIECDGECEGECTCAEKAEDEDRDRREDAQIEAYERRREG